MFATTPLLFSLFAFGHALTILSPASLPHHIPTVILNRFIGLPADEIPANLTAPLVFFGARTFANCHQLNEDGVRESLRDKIVLVENSGPTASIVDEEFFARCLEKEQVVAIVRIIHFPYSPGMQFYWMDTKLHQDVRTPTLHATIEQFQSVIDALKSNVTVVARIDVDRNPWAEIFRGPAFLAFFRIGISLLNAFGVFVAFEAFVSHLYRRFYPEKLAVQPIVPQASFGRQPSMRKGSFRADQASAQTMNVVQGLKPQGSFTANRPTPSPNQANLPRVLSSMTSFGPTNPPPACGVTVRQPKDQLNPKDKTSALMITGSLVELLACTARVVYFAGGGILSTSTYPFAWHMVMMNGTISVDLITTLIGVVMFLRWSASRETNWRERLEKTVLVFGVVMFFVTALLSVLQGLHIGEIVAMIQLTSALTFIALVASNVLFLWSGRKFVRKLENGMKIVADNAARRRSKTKAVVWLMASALAGLVQCIGMATVAIGTWHYQSAENYVLILSVIYFGLTMSGIAHAMAFRPFSEMRLPITAKMLQITGLKAVANGSLRVIEGIRSLSLSSTSTVQQPAVLIWSQSNNAEEPVV
eukprot:c13063_g1_i1.p1 GENE.c13063_g1_i1~~c13063_g1_i1.p1  ORF type:complete len:589 (+),score=103.21 c13063_g1_i1:40-1806(+)